MLPHYFKGSTIYVPFVERVRKAVPCPVCKGKGQILTKAVGDKDESGYVHECEYCRWAVRDGLPFGHVCEDYQWQGRVQTIVIEGVECTERPGKNEVKYLWNVSPCSWNSVDSSRAFATMKEAQQRAAEMLQETFNKEEEEKKKKLSQAAVANKSHSIGYAKNQVREMTKQIAWLKKQMAPWVKMVGYQGKK